MSTSGVLSSEEVALTQRVFKRVLAEAWFARSYENERDFAAAVIRLFQNGATYEDELEIQARNLARDRFRKE